MSKPIIHLAAPANPCGELLKYLNLKSTEEMVREVQRAVGSGFRVRSNARLVEARLTERKGGRIDDRARVRELQSVLENDDVVALVAMKGGGWLTRIIGDLDFRVLDRREVPLAIFGFSEITTLVNLIGLRRRGFGFYYMTPGYPATGMHRYAKRNAKRISGEELSGESAEAFADLYAYNFAPKQFHEYFSEIVSVLSGNAPKKKLTGRLVSGSLPVESSARFIGGCLSLVTPLTVAAYAKHIRPAGKWIVLEDLEEAPHRIDRQFAHIKLAGWFEKCAGVLIGDFHSGGRDQTAETLAILKYHLPTNRSVPVIHTKLVGHTWPQAMLPVGRKLNVHCEKGRGRHKKVTIDWPHDCWRIVGD